MSEKTYYDYQDIMRLCFVSRSRAYELIAMLNKELKDSGYIVPKLGRVLATTLIKGLGLLPDRKEKEYD